MFEFGGVQHVVVGFENKSVQICEMLSGKAVCCFEVNLTSFCTDTAKVTEVAHQRFEDTLSFNVQELYDQFPTQSSFDRRGSVQVRIQITP